jgi:hypothetical protein
MYLVFNTYQIHQLFTESKMWIFIKAGGSITGSHKSDLDLNLEGG